VGRPWRSLCEPPSSMPASTRSTHRAAIPAALQPFPPKWPNLPVTTSNTPHAGSPMTAIHLPCFLWPSRRVRWIPSHTTIVGHTGSTVGVGVRVGPHRPHRRVCWSPRMSPPLANLGRPAAGLLLDAVRPSVSLCLLWRTLHGYNPSRLLSLLPLLPRHHLGSLKGSLRGRSGRLLSDFPFHSPPGLLSYYRCCRCCCPAPHPIDIQSPPISTSAKVVVKTTTVSRLDVVGTHVQAVLTPIVLVLVLVWHPLR
jgi:hypothetical protein